MKQSDQADNKFSGSAMILCYGAGNKGVHVRTGKS